MIRHLRRKCFNRTNLARRPHDLANRGDLAPGTTHWRVPIAKGQELMRILRARLSGLATPSYMLDIPGGHGKAPIGPQWIHCGEDGEYVITDPQGVQHGYADRLGADG